jgi:neutral ceramidase
MHSKQHPKAGPSGLPTAQSGIQESSKRQQRVSLLIKLVSAAVLLALVYTVFIHDFTGQNGHFWRWKAQNGEEEFWSKGSQYLLGVGKADITG